MNNKISILIKLFITGMLILACQSVAPQISNIDQPSLIETSVFQTVSALGIEKQPDEVNSASTQVIQMAAETATPTVTETTTPTVTPTETVIPTSTASWNCYRIRFISDVTYPDGSSLPPDTAFTKIWRLRNDGTCTWNSDFEIVNVGGAGMGAPSGTTINTTVRPGETIDVSINLTSPSTPGYYTSYFKLLSSSGELFGWGRHGEEMFWAAINVWYYGYPSYYRPSWGYDYYYDYWDYDGYYPPY